MGQHLQPMPHLPRGQRPKKGRARRQRGNVGQALRPLPIAFRAETLEADRVIAVGSNPSAVAETRLPFLAALAGAVNVLGLVGGGERHLASTSILGGGCDRAGQSTRNPRISRGNLRSLPGQPATYRRTAIG